MGKMWRTPRLILLLIAENKNTAMGMSAINISRRCLRHSAGRSDGKKNEEKSGQRGFDEYGDWKVEPHAGLVALAENVRGAGAVLQDVKKSLHIRFGQEMKTSNAEDGVAKQRL